MRATDFANACAKFAESQRLDAALGTQLNLANCYERMGRTASAWAVYKEAVIVARRGKQVDRLRLAEDRIAALEPSLPMLRVVVDASRVSSGFVLRVDGTEIGRAEWDSAAPVDPGPHKVEALAPGKEPWSTDIAARPASKAEVVVPALADASSARDPVAPASSSLANQQIAGLVAGGVGVVGLVLGTVFGLDAKSDNDAALTHCPSSPACNDATGVTLTHQAESAATASTAFFIAGGALVAGGAIVFFTAPRSARAASVTTALAPLVGPHFTGLGAGGTW